MPAGGGGENVEAGGARNTVISSNCFVSIQIDRCIIMVSTCGSCYNELSEYSIINFVSNHPVLAVYFCFSPFTALNPEGCSKSPFATSDALLSSE